MKIGEIARTAGMATSAIRFYETSGLLPPPDRTSSGYRDYDPTILERLAFIRAGQAVGLTLGELREVMEIRQGGEAPCRHVTELIETRIREVDERIRDLGRLRKNLSSLAGTAAGVDPAECPPASVCRIISDVR